MVVLHDVGLRVRVLVKGKPAREYLGDDDDRINSVLNAAMMPSMCHRFVESVSGADFSIEVESLTTSTTLNAWLMESRMHGILFTMFVDGQDTSTTHVTHDDRSSDMSFFYHSENDTEQQYRFAVISTIEDAARDMVAEHTERAKDLGTIQVRAYRGIQRESDETLALPHETGRNSHETLLGEDEVVLAEEALKGRAVTHGATLGPANESRPSFEETLWDNVDEEGVPVAVFKFTYRSKHGLQQEGVICRTPSPEPISEREQREHFSVDDLSLGELRRLAQDRLSDLRNRKRAADVKLESPERKVVARPLKHVRLSNVREVVDLTGDD